MPNEADGTPIQAAWIGFTNSTRTLLVPLPDDRPMDQYLPLRDEILSLVQSEGFLRQLELGWKQSFIYPGDTPTDGLASKVGEILLLELTSFPRAVEVAQATGNTSAPKGWFGKWLGRASTVTKSVSDVLENLPPGVKAGLTLFNELVDLFRGKD